VPALIRGVLQLLPAVTANPAAMIVATGTSFRHQIRDLTGRTALHPLEVLAGALVLPRAHEPGRC
jgi:hypothetical protein